MRLTHTSLSCIIKEYQPTNEGLKMKQLIKVLEKINKQLEISNKIASSKLVIDTIESNTLKTLTDKQLESITPVATDKIKSIHKNIYS